MPSFDEVRKLYPGWKDNDIIDSIAKDNNVDPGYVMGYLGYEPDKSSPVMRGVKQAGLQLAGTVPGAIGLAGGLMGADSVKNWGMEHAKEYFDRADALGRPEDDVANLSWDNAGSFVKHGLGYVGAQIIPSILTGGLGSFVAKRAAQVGVEAATKEAVEAAVIAGVPRQLAEKEVLAQVTTPMMEHAAARGALAGAGGLSYAQEGASIYNDQLANGNDDPWRAAGMAVPAAALDVVGEMPALNKIAKGAMPKWAERAFGAGEDAGFWKGRALAALKGAALEGGTEGAQTVMERIGAMQNLNDSDAWHDYANSMALGALGGGVMGGVAGPQRVSSDRPTDLLQQQMDLRSGGMPTDQTHPGTQLELPMAAPWASPNLPQGGRGLQGDLFGQHQYVDFSPQALQSGGQQLDLIAPDYREASQQGALDFDWVPRTRGYQQISVIGGEQQAQAPVNIVLPNQPQPTAFSAAPTTQDLAVRAYAKQQRGELLSAYEKYLVQHLAQPELAVEQAAQRPVGGIPQNRDLFGTLTPHGEAPVAAAPNPGAPVIQEDSTLPMFDRQGNPTYNANPDIKSQPVPAIGKGAKRKDAFSAINVALADGHITPEQHVELVNDMHSGAKLPKVAQRLQGFIEENNAAQAQLQGEQNGLSGQDVHSGNPENQSVATQSTEAAQSVGSNPQNSEAQADQVQPTEVSGSSPSPEDYQFYQGKKLDAELRFDPETSLRSATNYGWVHSYLQAQKDLASKDPKVQAAAKAALDALSPQEHEVAEHRVAALAKVEASNERVGKEAKKNQKAIYDSEDYASSKRKGAKRTKDEVDLDAEVERHMASSDQEYSGDMDGQDVMFSRNERQAGSTKEDVEAKAKAELSGSKGAPSLTVVQSVEELPFDAPNDAQGAIYKGRLFLVADNISGSANLQNVIKHELAHHGLRGFFGSALDKTLQFIHAANPTIRKYAKEWVTQNQDLIKQNGWTAEITRFKAQDEAMARMASEGKVFNGARRLAAKIQDILRAIGLNKLADKLEAHTDAEAIRMLDKAGMFVREGVKESAPISGDTSPAFARAVAANESAERFGGTQGKQILDDARQFFKENRGAFSFLPSLVKRIEAAGVPSARKWYNAMLEKQKTRLELERAVDQVLSAKVLNDDKAYNRINEFIGNSTFEQKWGYTPKWYKNFASEGQVEDPQFKAAWKKLSAEEQEVIDAVFEHGYNTRIRLMDLLKKVGLDNAMGRFGQLKGPYAPLKRFGKYVAVLKSKDLVAAEKADDTKLVETLKTDAKHYQVSHFDTMGQAQKFIDANKGGYAFTDAFKDDANVENTKTLDYAVLQKVLAAVKAEDLPPPAKQAMFDTVNALYATALEESSARMSGFKRKNRAGYDKDMIRSFAAGGRANAIYLANMEHGGDINDAFYQMQKEVKDDSGKRVHQNEFNTIAAHYADSLTYNPTPFQDAALAATTAMQLSTSLGYHVANATQPVMVTLPRIASDFNDYQGAWTHLLAGYKLIGSIAKGTNVDFNKITNLGLRDTLETAANFGLMDVGLEEDLAHFNRFRTGYAVIDAASKTLGSVVHRLRQIARRVELWNRISSGAAAYNMAVSHGKSAVEAKQYALDVLAETQGDFSRIAAPLVLKKMPKVTVQYRKYQMLMAAVYTKAFSQAFYGADAEERAVGKRMLAYKLFHTSMAAGVLGWPVMNIAALVFAALGGDDDKWDLEESLKKAIGDNDIAKLLLHGPFAAMGLDLSAKLGEDKVFALSPYNDLDFSSGKAAMQTVGTLVAGPTGGLLSKFIDGASLMGKGDLYKGAEKFMPKGIESAMQSFRIANDGYTMKNGDVLVKPEDISALTLALNSVGLPATELKDIQRLRGLQYEAQKFFKDRTTEIEQEYYQAFKDKDTEAMSELKDHWIALQKSKDEWRSVFNDSHDFLKKQPLSNLLKYPQSRMKKESKQQVAFSPES